MQTNSVIEVGNFENRVACFNRARYPCRMIAPNQTELDGLPTGLTPQKLWPFYAIAWWVGAMSIFINDNE